MFNDEYLDMDFFIYYAIIVEYKNNFPCIVSFCENILNEVYVINKYATNLDKHITKTKLLCINTDHLDKSDINNIEIHNGNGVFIKNIIYSEYIDLDSLWSLSNEYMYILYTIQNNTIKLIMFSKKKHKIEQYMKELNNVYLIKLNINKYYSSYYKMDTFIYKQS